MKLVLTDATQFDIDFIQKGNSGNEKNDKTNRTTIYFKIDESTDFDNFLNQINTALTDINVQGAYIIRDDQKKVNLNCKECLNTSVTISDTEFTLVAVLE